MTTTSLYNSRMWQPSIESKVRPNTIHAWSLGTAKRNFYYKYCWQEEEQ